MRPYRALLAFGLMSITLIWSGNLAAQTSAPQPLPGPGRIEELLRGGWEVAGYVAASDIRTLVLLKHKDNPWLVQCSVLIDVTRTPRMVTTCYEVR